MWLLNFHFAFSLLCWLAFAGIAIVFRSEMEKNGWTSPSPVSTKDIIKLVVFLIPIINVLAVVALWLMVITPKEDFEKKFGNEKL